jgi:hypothetical protein
MTTRNTLRETLAAVGKETCWHELPDGSRTLLLPYGGRVLGLFPPASQHNFYWVNPALSQVASSRELFGTKGWRNTGGDRTWLAPEIEIFFPDYPRCQNHVEPPALDATEYTVDAGPSGVTLTRAMTLSFFRAQKKIRLRLSKWVGPALNPLRHEQSAKRLLARIEYAGYTQQTHVKLLGSIAMSPIPVGIWNLIQLSHGGEMIIPTYRQAQPRVLFGHIPADALAVETRCVRFRANLRGEHKIAVRAAVSTGRVGYVWKSGRDWSLLVRNFFVNPSGEYVDVPKDDPTDYGYAVHAVNVLSGLGNFCELEYHAPAFGGNPQSVESTDVSQVWAFRGPKAAIGKLAEMLLGVKPSWTAGVTT